MTTSKTLSSTLPAAVLATLALAAAPVAAAPAALHADAEIDPTAYALAGNSIHVGVGAGHLRVDLGNFAMALPAFAHADDGFDVSFYGYGAKLQYFGRASQRGWFAGVDAGVLRVLARRQGTELTATQLQIGVGVHAGYRISLPAGFYATPWLGVGYDLGADPITLGGGTYKPSKISVFPAIHFGYAFR
jgi:hypothetical protein